MAALKASEQGLVKIKQARNERGWKVESPHWLWESSRSLDPTRNWEIEKTVAAGVSLGTWKRFLAGKPIRTEVFQAFCQALRLSWEEVAERGYKPAASETEQMLAQRSEEATLFLDWDVHRMSLFSMDGLKS
ncbi:MAG: hypothetical protein HC866_03580 [Leptolyngbyaceae cyanobacterium RU_5_1]|nr:hypothetical protein [Leptolyngbyaceae cyanobacterium RU_5_1]